LLKHFTNRSTSNYLPEITEPGWFYLNPFSDSIHKPANLKSGIIHKNIRILRLLCLTWPLVACGNAQNEKTDGYITGNDGAQATIKVLHLEPGFNVDDTGMPWLSPLRSGGVLTSWIRTVDDIPRLEYSRFEEEIWSKPYLVAEQQPDQEWFVNWADFPSVIELGDGSLASHYLVSSGENIYAYDVHIARSGPEGNWLPSLVPHRDETLTEHGFVSLLPFGTQGVMAVWLDGRNTAGGHFGSGGGPMTLRSAVLGPDGLSREFELDPSVCECCQTTAVLLPDGALAAYRNRTEKEIRDISVVRFRNGTWEEPRVLYQDGWEIFGCPVNGPAMSAIDETVAAAWFTAAEDSARVRVAFSGDGGDSWSDPVTADKGFPLGRVDILLIDEQTALLSWIGQEKSDAQIHVRLIDRNGTTGPVVIVSTGPDLAGRASGFPRMAKYGENEVLIAWTSITGNLRQIQVRKLQISR
jgi:hypothetical protein